MSQWFVLEDDSAGADTITPLLAALHTATSAKYSGTVVQSTRVSAHSANRILVKANITDAERTGALAALARDQLGVGIFKDEFVGHPDKELRVFGLLGEGEYAGQVWYIRPRITYSTVDQTPTRITLYGDGSGKTYGDAIAGPKGWQDNLVNVTTMFRAYLVGEHIMGEADTPADGTLESAGVIDVTRSGTSADVRTELRFDYPEITHNGAAFDRGVYYGGLMLNGAGKSWTEGVIKLPYAPGTALVAGDNGLTITMDTDGDTGRIIDFDGSHIWVATDGAVANSFDNLPTSNDTFTITTGTGTGSQNGAGTLESGVYWYTIPSSMASGTWLYDPGSAFGNSVNKNTHTTRSPHWGGTMTVQDANGGNELIKQDSVADVASTESSYRRAVAATNGVAVVHLAGGTDPTNRVMAQGFGIRLDLSAAIDNVLLLGERARVVHNQQGGANTRLWPINNFRVEDFSR
ncbi:MAG: hypothetical protein OEU46_17405, partial [Alphaproteobacteria bacterium]|nr:hypothetical protein [Alphaproteobacteria bacterium]